MNWNFKPNPFSRLSIAMILCIAEMTVAAYFTYVYLPRITAYFLNVVLVGNLITLTIVLWLTVFQFKDAWINKPLFPMAQLARSRPAVNRGEVALLSITYGTRSEMPAETAQEMANRLRTKFGLDVQVIDLNEYPSPDLAQYNHIILGTSTAIKQWTPPALQGLKDPEEEKDKSVAVLPSITDDA